MLLFALLLGIWGVVILISPIFVFILLNRINELEKQVHLLELKVPEAQIPVHLIEEDSLQDQPPAPVMAEHINQTPAETAAQAPLAQEQQHAVPTLPEVQEQAQPQEPLFEQAQPVLSQETADDNDSHVKGVNVEKVLSWTGGFILFLGLAFLLKYSIDNALLSPQMRIMLSRILGAGLLAAGLLLRNPKVKTTADTLSGCGLAVLYASVFAAHAFYELIPVNTAFMLMGGIALLSFGIAVWKNAKYIGFLAEITGFLTPLILSLPDLNPVFFLSYVAFINAAAAAAALKRGWNGLLAGAGVLILLSQVFIWQNTDIAVKEPLTFCLFAALFTAGMTFIMARFKHLISLTAAGVLSFFTALNLLFVWLAGNATNGNLSDAILFLGLALWLNIQLAFLAYREHSRYAPAFLAGKVLVFMALCTWTGILSSAANTLLLFCFFLGFAAVNGATDLLLYKKKAVTPGMAGVLFPAALMLPLLFGQTSVTLAAPALTLMSVFLVLSAVYAWVKGKPLFALLSAALLFCGAVKFTFFVPSAEVGCWPGIFAFTVLPMAAIFLVARKMHTPDNALHAQVTVFASALTPYLLAALWLAKTNVPVHLLFGFALAVTLINGFFVYVYKNAKPLLGALAGVTLLQLVAINLLLNAPAPSPFIQWTLTLFAVFALYPFVFKQRFMDDTSAWAACALSGLPAAAVCYIAMKHSYQTSLPGLLPLAFAMLYLTGINMVYYWQPVQEGIQRNRLAWLGGVTLAFITAVLPAQFGQQWLTLAFAAEGAALAGLNRRLRHNGLLLVSGALLTFVFIRLVMFIPVGQEFTNGIPFFNKYLYTFSLSGLAMLTAAHRWPNEKEDSFAPVLKALGVLTWFILLNLQIAFHFYSGGPLAFNFTGNFSSAIMYTAGWTFFGAALLLAGWAKKSSVWYCGLTLIFAALLKLFLSDIWTLGGLYRIGGMIGIAVILITVSFIFQNLRRTR